MNNPVLKPGGFWICPTCGQRNKVWAPCSRCGTALADMAGQAEAWRDVAPAVAPQGMAPPGRTIWPYALVGLAVLTAVAIGVLLTRVLGGAAVAGPSAAPAPPSLASAGPGVPPPAPAVLPGETLAQAASPLPDLAPAAPPPTAPPATVPPPAVYTPSVPGRSPGYSFPAPAGRSAATRSPGDARPSEVPREREQAVRAARDRFRRAEAALAAAEGGDPETEAEAMAVLDQAARDLREAEAALDRARRRRPR
jgi:hypothetical protein